MWAGYKHNNEVLPTKNLNLNAFKSLMYSILRRIDDPGANTVFNTISRNGFVMTSDRQINCCAQLLFERVINDPKCSRKCAEFSKLLSNLSDTSSALKFRHFLIKLSQIHNVEGSNAIQFITELQELQLIPLLQMEPGQTTTDESCSDDTTLSVSREDDCTEDIRVLTIDKKEEEEENQLETSSVPGQHDFPSIQINNHLDSILENLKEGENDDIAEQMKNSGLKLTDENQLNSCALHLFEKALIDKSFSRKCSLIAQAIANVTVPSSLDPALSVSFREAMVRLTHKHFKAVKEQQFDSESCCAVLNFLADLYKVDFLSTQIINYWRTSLQEAPTSELGKYFTDIVQDIQSSKTDQNMYRELYKKVMISDMKKALSIPNLSSPALGHQSKVMTYSAIAKSQDNLNQSESLKIIPITIPMLDRFRTVTERISTNNTLQIINELKELNAPSDAASLAEYAKILITLGVSKPHCAQTTASICKTLPSIVMPLRNLKSFKLHLKKAMTPVIETINKTPQNIPHAIGMAHFVSLLCLEDAYDIYCIAQSMNDLVEFSENNDSHVAILMLITFLKHVSHVLFQGNHYNKMKLQIIAQLEEKIPKLNFSIAIENEAIKQIQKLQGLEVNNSMTMASWIKNVRKSCKTETKTISVPVSKSFQSTVAVIPSPHKQTPISNISYPNNLMSNFKLMINDANLYKIEDLQKIVAQMKIETELEMTEFVKIFYEAAVNSKDPPMFVRIAKFIELATGSDLFRKTFAKHAIHEASRFKHVIITEGIAKLKIVGELFNIGWITFNGIKGLIYALPANFFEDNAKLKLFYVLVKSVAIKISQTGDGAVFRKIRSMLLVKMETNLNCRIQMMIDELLVLLHWIWSQSAAIFGVTMNQNAIESFTILLPQVTNENVTAIADLVMSLEIKNNATLEAIANALIEAASDNIENHQAYAKLTNGLSKLTTESFNVLNVFLKLLEKQCLTYFNDNIKIILQSPSPEIEMKNFGLVNFICELFKISMAVVKVIYECLDKLLAHCLQSHAVECTQLIITKTGAKLDKIDSSKMDLYFRFFSEVLLKEGSARSTTFLELIRLRVEWQTGNETSSDQAANELLIKKINSIKNGKMEEELPTSSTIEAETKSVEIISEHKMELCIHKIDQRAAADLAHVADYVNLCNNPSSMFDNAAIIDGFKKKHFEMEEIISFKLLVEPKIRSIQWQDVNQTAEEIMFLCEEMNEDRFICCAQLVFDIAINKKNSSIKCAEFFKVFSDQTAIRYVDMPITFKDLVRNISQEHFDLIKNDQVNKEKCLLILRFLANLFGVEMLSSELMHSWQTTLNELPNDEIAKYFECCLNLTTLEKKKTDQNLLPTSSVNQSSSLDFSPSLTGRLAEYLEEIRVDNNASFDFGIFNNGTLEDKSDCASLLLSHVATHANNENFKLYAEIAQKIDQHFPYIGKSFLNQIDFVQKINQDLALKKPTKKARKGLIEWKEITGIGLLLSELYNLCLLKAEIIILWMDRIRIYVDIRIEAAADCMLLVFKNCALNIKERCPENCATYIKYFRRIFSKDRISFSQKAMIDEILAVCSEIPLQATLKSQIGPRCPLQPTVKPQDTIMTNFQVFLDNLKEGKKANFSFDNYQPQEVDFELCISLLFNYAVENSYQLPLYIGFIDEISKTKHFLSFRKCLIALCKHHFEQQYAEKNMSIEFIRLIGELYNIDALASLTLKGFLECLMQSEQTRENFRQLVAITKDKILRLRGRNVSEATRILIDMVEKNQSTVTGTIPKLANCTASGEASKTFYETLTQQLNMPGDDIKMIFQNLPKVEDLETLRDCAEVLVQKSAENPELVSDYAIILCRLASDDFTRRSVKDVIVSVCEAKCQELFGGRLEIVKPLNQALGIIGLIAELFKRRNYPIGIANMTLNKLYKSAQGQQEEISMEVFVAFLEAAVENYLKIGCLQLEVFWFLVTQQSNKYISRQLRKRTKEIVSLVNKFMENKLGPIRADDVQRSNKSNDSEDFLHEFKTILAKLTPITTKEILVEIKDKLNGTSLLRTEPLLRQMAELMGKQTIVQPHLRASIIDICEELQRGKRQKALLIIMKTFIENQFEECWVDGRLAASFKRMEAIQTCLVELFARGHINEVNLAMKIYRFLISFETDKTATLPVLLDFIQKVKVVLQTVKKNNQVQSALQSVEDTLTAELENSNSDGLIEEIRKTLKILARYEPDFVFEHSQQDIEEDESKEADGKSVASNWDDTDEEESNPNFEQHEVEKLELATSARVDHPKSTGERSTEDISEHKMQLCINDIHDRATADLAHVSEYTKLCENSSSFFDDAAKIASFQKKHFELYHQN